MDLFKRDECQGCHKPVFWASSGIGNMMMLDYEPDPDGNLDIEIGPHGLPVYTIVDRESVHLPGMELDRYVAHFATCVHQKMWTKDSRGHHRPPVIGRKSGE